MVERRAASNMTCDCQPRVLLEEKFHAARRECFEAPQGSALGETVTVQ